MHSAGEASPRIRARLSPSSSGCWPTPFACKFDVCSAERRDMRLPGASPSLSPVPLVSVSVSRLQVALLAHAHGEEANVRSTHLRGLVSLATHIHASASALLLCCALHKRKHKLPALLLHRMFFSSFNLKLAEVAPNGWVGMQGRRSLPLPKAAGSPFLSSFSAPATPAKIEGSLAAPHRAQQPESYSTSLM